MNGINTCVFIVPEQLDCDVLLSYQEQCSEVSDDKQIIVDFKNIKQVDYVFLHTLVSMRTCFSSCNNEIRFINYSSEVKELFDEVHLKSFLDITNLIH